MDKRSCIIILAFVVVLVLAASYVLLVPRDAYTPPPTLQPATAEDSTADDDSTARNTQPAAYVDYTAANFAQDTRTKVLFFYADWCPKCRALDADIQQHLGELHDITIYKVDYDRETELRQHYGVTLQTTLVKTDGQGAKLTSYVAYDTPTLTAARDNLAL